jgi:hypothetical protein
MIPDSSILPDSAMLDLGDGTGAIRDDALHMSLALTRRCGVKETNRRTSKEHKERVQIHLN